MATTTHADRRGDLLDADAFLLAAVAAVDGWPRLHGAGGELAGRWRRAELMADLADYPAELSDVVDNRP